MAGIFAFYAFVGPFAGVVIFAIWFGLLILTGPVPPDASRAEGALEALRWVLIIIFAGMPVGYSVGLLAAAGVGLAVAVSGWRSGVVSWRIALGVTFAIWLVPYLYAGNLYVSGDVRLSRTNALLPVYLTTAALCTWIARRIFKTTPSTSGNPGSGNNGE